jgi:hypothetical protein
MSDWGVEAIEGGVLRCSRSFRGGHWPMFEDPDNTAREAASFFEPLLARHRPT